MHAYTCQMVSIVSLIGCTYCLLALNCNLLIFWCLVIARSSHPLLSEALFVLRIFGWTLRALPSVHISQGWLQFEPALGRVLRDMVDHIGKVIFREHCVVRHHVVIILRIYLLACLLYIRIHLILLWQIGLRIDSTLMLLIGLDGHPCPEVWHG